MSDASREKSWTAQGGLLTAEGGRTDGSVIVADEEDEDSAAIAGVAVVPSVRRPFPAKYVDAVVCWSTHAVNGELLPPPLP